MRLAVFGAGGRMGAAVVRLATEGGDLIVGAAESASSPLLGRDVGELSAVGHLGVALTSDTDAALLGAEAVIDFSTPKATSLVANAVKRAKLPWVCGTTGLDAAANKAIDEAAEVVPVLWAANMSTGVQVLAELVREAVKRLGPGFDVEIIETHHRKKADAPSGTAKRLAEAVHEGRGGLRELTGRDGLVGARRHDELAVLAVRGGDVIGAHTVHLLGEGERIEITHRATNRDLFARGAITAAKFLAGRSPGKYRIADVVAERR